MTFNEESAEQLLRDLALSDDDRADLLDKTVGRAANSQSHTGTMRPPGSTGRRDAASAQRESRLP